MKTTNTNFDGSRAQWRGEIERTWKLVRLYPDHHDHAVAGTRNHAREAIRPDTRVRLVVGVNIEIDVQPKDGAFSTIPGQTIQGSQRVGRYGRTQPLDDISVVIVMRWLDQYEAEAPPLARLQCCRRTHTTPLARTIN